MQKSIDAMLDKLANDEKKLNKVSEYLFNLLEKHSLLNTSEYLAIKILTSVRFKLCAQNSNSVSYVFF